MYITFFVDLTKIGIILIHSHWAAIVVWAVVIFLLDNLVEKRSVELTEQSGAACFKNSCSTPIENHCYIPMNSIQEKSSNRKDKLFN